MRRLLLTVVVAFVLAGCAGSPPPSVTDQIGIPTDTLPASTITRTPLPSLTPSTTWTPLAQNAQNTALPTSTPSGNNVAATQAPAATTPAGPVQPTSTSALAAATRAETITAIPTQPALLPGNPPPMDIKLPAGWQHNYSIVPIRESLTSAALNMAFYTGPVKTGQGTIIVLWGFPSVVAPPTVAPPGPTATNAPDVTPLDYQSQMLWTTGLQLLTGTVFDIVCNTAQYGERTFSIGNKNAVGTYFNVSQCPGTPDTIGWFAALNQFGGNYMFVMYVDPSTAYNDSRGDLQAILDTVTFHAPNNATPAATAGVTPGATLAGPPPTNTKSPG